MTYATTGATIHRAEPPGTWTRCGLSTANMNHAPTPPEPDAAGWPRPCPYCYAPDDPDRPTPRGPTMSAPAGNHQPEPAAPADPAARNSQSEIVREVQPPIIRARVESRLSYGPEPRTYYVVVETVGQHRDADGRVIMMTMVWPGIYATADGARAAIAAEEASEARKRPHYFTRGADQPLGNINVCDICGGPSGLAVHLVERR